MTALAGPSFVHATVVVVGEAGILIQGPSGSGKTALATALLADAALAHRFARLVGDDRVGLTRANGRVVAIPHPSIAGRMERRGLGIVTVEHEPACVVTLCISLVAALARMSERHPPAPPSLVLHDVEIPLLTLLTADGARENSRKVLTNMSVF